ncbi:putative ABC transport system permease protein [Saccharothrix carnea]|uniref:Putative ABC transport system permease protein n=1 Tax=Saccharothrix carnea TaxID=1280637 RepID=A0A2P8IES2_SACCR|nr:ABC transporter permease [Saccharothrix carnea]PSL56954.1 putative ABC transport system permease protein [Saccharothrix carnea]
MTLRLAVASVRRRLGAFVGTFLTAFLAVALISGSGSLLYSVLTAGPGADRFAGVDVVVAEKRSVELTTRHDKGDEVKEKTKTERLTGAVPLPADLVAAVAATTGVGEVVADSAFPVALDLEGVPVRAPERAAVVAHGWASAPLTPYVLRDGTAPATNEVAVGAELGLTTGQTVGLTTRTGTRDARVSGVVTGGVPGQAAIFVADRQVGEWSGLTGPTAIAVQVVPGFSPDDVVSALAGLGAGVFTGDEKVHGDLPGAVPDYVGAVSIFGFLLGITGFAAVFVLTGTVSLAVRQRLRELALLRTAGATPRQLRRLLATEITLVTVVATVPALPIGVVVAHVVAGRFRELGAVPAQFTVAVNPVVLIASAVLGLLVTRLATAVAARRAVRISPTQALRETVTDARAGRVPRVVAAVVLTAGAVAVLGIVPLGGPLGMGMGFVSCALLLCAAATLGPILVGGVTAVVSRLVGSTGVLGRVAGAMTRVESRRVVGVAIPLTLMFAINATMLVNGDILGAVTAEQEATRVAPATTRVTASNAPGLPLAVAERVAALPSVTGSALTLGTRVVVDQDGKPEDYPAQGLRSAGERALDLGVTAGNLGDVDGGSVAVSAPLAGQRGWRLGDRPTFWLADGTRVALRVVAVFEHWRGFGDLVLDAGLVAAHDPRGLVGSVHLRGEPDLAGFPVVAASNAVPEAENQQAAWELMVAVSLGFTAIAVVNTFAVATGARRREFAGLRLAGATARQVHRLLDREAVITVAVALVLGCVISGIVVGAFSVAQDGRWRMFADPVRYLGMVAGVGLLGLVAGAVPARLVVRFRALPQLG